VIARTTEGDGRRGGFIIQMSGCHIKGWQKGSRGVWKPCKVLFAQDAKRLIVSDLVHRARNDLRSASGVARGLRPIALTLSQKNRGQGGENHLF
jgi:hypothetical protein